MFSEIEVDIENVTAVPCALLFLECIKAPAQEPEGRIRSRIVSNNRLAFF